MKNRIWFVFFVLACCMTACFEDDSFEGTGEVSGIEISGLRDTSILSFVGNVWQLRPEIETVYPESSLSYAWYMYPSSADELENGYRENRIAETRELDYEVNLASGDYTFVFEVSSAEDGYTSMTSMKLRATTAFSEGFYILKEVPGGGTDIDVLAGALLNEDLIAGMTGAPLTGKPTNLSVTYDNCYIDEDDQEMTYTNMVHVFTDAGLYRSYRTEDMAGIFDNGSVRFDGLEAGEEPYIACNGMMYMFYLTSKGVYSGLPGTLSESSGRYGMPAPGDRGGSKYIFPVGGGWTGYYYWNNEMHGVYMTDYGGGMASPVEYDADGVPEADLECIGGGVNYVGWTETSYFLCKSKKDARCYLYLIDNFGMIKIRKLAADLHVSRGSMVAVCGLQGTFLYSVHDNAVYAYNWEAGEEFKVSLPGIDTNKETISYVTNQYLNIAWGDTGDNFDSLIVATRSGDNYTLYVYKDLVGGVPDPDKMPQVVHGVGRVECVRFVTAKSLSSSFMMSMGAPLVPYWN